MFTLESDLPHRALVTEHLTLVWQVNIAPCASVASRLHQGPSVTYVSTSVTWDPATSGTNIRVNDFANRHEESVALELKQGTSELGITLRNQCGIRDRLKEPITSGTDVGNQRCNGPTSRASDDISHQGHMDQRRVTGRRSAGNDWALPAGSPATKSAARGPSSGGAITVLRIVQFIVPQSRLS